MGDDYSVYWFQRLIQKATSYRPTSWVASRTFHHLDPIVYKMSGSRFTMVSVLGGLPVITLTTTGAKSGLQRSTPLVGIPAGNDLIVIASNWGQKHHPGWYYNLRANPEVEVTIGRTKSDYIARDVTDAEYDDYWEKAVSISGNYNAYKKRTGGRKIPIVVLTPVEA